jgi:hypothetical protein
VRARRSASEGGHGLFCIRPSGDAPPPHHTSSLSNTPVRHYREVAWNAQFISTNIKISLTRSILIYMSAELTSNVS